MKTCVMPGCVRPPSTKNRSEQDVCEQHKRVAVSGSWMGEGQNHAKEPME